MAAGSFIPPKTPELKLCRSTKGDDQKDVKTQPDPPYMQPSSKGSKAVDAIPTEIWTEIFHWFLHFHSSDDSSAEPLSCPSPSTSLSRNLLTIAQVCRYWCEIIFIDATFWTRRSVRVRSKSSERANQVVRLQEWVDWSQQLPLSLTIVEPSEPLTDEDALTRNGPSPPMHMAICDFVKKNRTRWHTLDITFSPIIDCRPQGPVFHLRDFPNLRGLTLRAAQTGRIQFCPPRMAITTPKLYQICVFGRVHVVRTSESTSGQESSPYFATKKVVIREQHITDFMNSFSKGVQNFSSGDDIGEVAVEEIHYINECEPATHTLNFHYPSITLRHLTSFTAKFGAPANCTWLLDHMECFSLTTLDLTTSCGPGGPLPLENIGAFITRNGQNLQVLRLSAVDVHEGEMLGVLGTHGGNLKELHLVHIEGARPAGSFISNETFTRLTLPTPTANAHAGDIYHQCILPNLSKFSYIGHTKDLTLSCICKMIESRTTMLLSRGNEERTANGVVMDSFTLKSKDCFAANDPKVVRSLQGLLNEGRTDLHIEASGKPIVRSNRS